MLWCNLLTGEKVVFTLTSPYSARGEHRRWWCQFSSDLVIINIGTPSQPNAQGGTGWLRSTEQAPTSPVSPLAIPREEFLRPAGGIERSRSQAWLRSWPGQRGGREWLRLEAKIWRRSRTARPGGPLHVTPYQDPGVSPGATERDWRVIHSQETPPGLWSDLRKDQHAWLHHETSSITKIIHQPADYGKLKWNCSLLFMLNGLIEVVMWYLLIIQHWC